MVKTTVIKFLKKRWWLLIVIGVVILLVKGRQTKPAEVELATVGTKTITRTVTASGSLAVPDTDKVFAPLSGQINDVQITEGSVVKKGDVLLTYQAEPLAVAVAQAQSAYAAALKAQQTLNNTSLTDLDIKALQASVDQTRAAKDAAQFTYDQTNNETNKAALNTAVTAHETALAKYYSALKTNPNAVDTAATASAVTAAQTAWQESQRNYNQRVVTAPHAGVVSLNRDATGAVAAVANKVTGQGQHLFSIMTPNSLQFQAEVDENDVATLQLNQDVNLELDAYPGDVFVGQVVRIAGQTSINSSGSSVYLVAVTVTEPAKTFRAGLSGQASFILQTVKDVVAVPVRAITIKDDADNVFVFNSGNIKLQPVKLGVQSATDAQVISGLKQGDQVVVSNNLRDLIDGQAAASSK
ncbi:MAG: efflux RND transporter periplasmic adaptor subunit [bacterium]|nr:efflux RND transporter periplasmic adaptor subunit [bacterium]